MREWLLTIVLAAPVLGAEPRACLWMNAASAGGYLGGPVSETAPCNFSRAKALLTIEVTSGHDLAPLLGKCTSPAVPLQAIGNEAFACTTAKGEEAIGRVRDQMFAITVVAGDKPDVLREKVRKAAEQVAGNLY